MDLTSINTFYRSRIGKSARHIISMNVRKLIGAQKGLTILGVGYANPYLRRFFLSSETIVSITIPYIGEVRWPRLEDNRCVSADEDHFPLQNNSIDVAVLIHALEFAESPWAMLAEVNRVLPEGGRVIVVVANRGGMWARKSSVVFGHGLPYTKGQLHTLMTSAGFVCIGIKYTLFFPPFKIFSNSKISIFLERWAGWLMRENSGVIIGEYEKQCLKPVSTKKKTNFKVKKQFGESVVT